ncbi:MAG: PRC-barrel domain-containing protein [Mycobacteriaceae bacterium]|nr:PRC-barrel domain-containing protein [Mycobacteriaceae bacterium]
MSQAWAPNMPLRTNPTAMLRARITFRRAIAGQVVSVAQLLGRPVRDDAGTRVGRVADVVVRVSVADVTMAQQETSKPACLRFVVLLSVKSPRDSRMSAPITRA